MGRKRLSLFGGLFLFVLAVQSKPVSCHEDSTAQGRRDLLPDSVTESAGRSFLPADTLRFSRFQVALDNLGQTHLFRASYLGVPLCLRRTCREAPGFEVQALAQRFHAPVSSSSRQLYPVRARRGRVSPVGWCAVARLVWANVCERCLLGGLDDRSRPRFEALHPRRAS